MLRDAESQSETSASLFYRRILRAKRHNTKLICPGWDHRNGCESQKAFYVQYGPYHISSFKVTDAALPCVDLQSSFLWTVAFYGSSAHWDVYEGLEQHQTEWKKCSTPWERNIFRENLLPFPGCPHSPPFSPSFHWYTVPLRYKCVFSGSFNCAWVKYRY